MQTSVIEERIDGEVIRMIEHVLHRHVKNDLKVLFHVSGLKQRKIADVGPVVAQGVAANVTEWRAEDTVRSWTVGDEPHVLVGDNLGRVLWIGHRIPARVSCGADCAVVKGIEAYQGSWRNRRVAA